MHPSWARLAHQRHAALLGGQLTLDLPCGRLAAVHSEPDSAPATVVQLELGSPVAIRFSLREERESDLWEMWEDPEVTFDDPAFDDAFLIRGDPYLVKMVIGEELRRALVSLHNLCDHISLDSRRVIALVHGPPLPADRLAILLDHVEDVGMLLAPRREASGSPYRD
jgi:hypothetical protein